jgi:thioredoxin-related protein
MLNVIIIIILFIITGSSLYMIDKLFEENIEIKPEGPIDTIDISTNFILVLSMEKCPYCEMLYNDYLSKTDKQYSIITYKSGQQLSFDNNFLDIPPEERENIINGLNKLLQGEFVFPTIIHNKKIIRGLKDKSVLDKIFK